MKIDNIFEKKEACRYIFWGVMTVLLNYFSYLFLKQFLAYQIANLLSLIITKVFAYCTNKKFVFRTKTNFKEQLTEIIRYILGRGFTGVVDFVGLIVLVDVFFIDDKLGKMVMIVITTALNYILGKLFVFKDTQDQNSA
ncbi:MAG: GtrA family protein [Clostridium sp.]|nr:GtrA family protein [Clostridium sp.]